MLRYLREARKIAQAQSDFQERFESAGEKRTVRVGHKGQIHEMEVTWLPSVGIWTGSRKLNNRYWNAFGAGQPHAPPRSNSITCEINFPLQGINRRIAGVLAEDDQGTVSVFHRGKIGGGRRGVGPKLFRDRFGGNWTLVEGDEVVEVGVISGPDLIAQVSHFVKEVDRIKPKS